MKLNYRLRRNLTCTNIFLKRTNFAATVFSLMTFLLIAASAAQAQYCTASCTYVCTSYDMSIESFSTTGGSTNISNLNQGCPSSGTYAYYSTMPHVTTTVGTIGFTVGTGDDYPTNIRIWVDWNGDGDFYDTGEQVAAVNGVSTSSNWSGSFSVPASTSAGTKRMRIRSFYTSYTPIPCGNTPYGDTEDYPLTLVAPPANDAGIAAILNPTLQACSLNSQDIKILLENLGNDTLHNCSIKYQINTSSVQSMYYTGAVAPLVGTRHC